MCCNFSWIFYLRSILSTFLTLVFNKFYPWYSGAKNCKSAFYLFFSRLTMSAPTATTASPAEPVGYDPDISKKYYPCFQKFLSYLDNTTYPLNYVHSQSRLLAITDQDIVRYFSHCVYKTETPDYENMEHGQIYLRSASVMYWKKAISAFLTVLHNDKSWHPVHKTGNPTRSKAVRSFIAKLKVFETRNIGLGSKARRPLKLAEFLNILELLRARSHGKWDKYRATSLLTFQWHIIGRIDDMVHLRFDQITPSPRYDFLLQIRVGWSKNIKDANRICTQFLMGSMDPRLCVLLNLALYLELAGSSARYEETEYIFALGANGHRIIREELGKLVEEDGFIARELGPIGTHSLRKGPATYCGSLGVSRENISKRGRWKADRLMVDVYISLTLPFPDAEVASKLAGPKGPCKYVMKSNAPQITDEALVAAMAPNIKRFMGHDVALVLAKALLWATFADDEENFIIMPKVMRERYITALARFGFSAGGENPVERVRYFVQPDGNNVRFVDSVCSSNDVGHSGNPYSFADNDNVLVSEMTAFRDEMRDMFMRLSADQSQTNRDVKRFEALFKRYSAMPGRRVAPAGLGNSTSNSTGTTGNITGPPAKLCSRPQNLYVVWEEYITGIGGNKPAKQFTSTERGAVKHVYSKRKGFWDLVQRMVNNGYTAQVSVDRIYAVYGQDKPVSYILKKILADKKNNHVHPQFV